MRCRLMYATLLQSSPSLILTKMSYSLINQTNKQTNKDWMQCLLNCDTYCDRVMNFKKHFYIFKNEKKKTINCMGTMQLKYCLNDENQVYKYWIEQIFIEAQLNCFNIECNRQLFSLYGRATDVDIVCTVINFFNERWNTYTSMWDANAPPKRSNQCDLKEYFVSTPTTAFLIHQKLLIHRNRAYDKRLRLRSFGTSDVFRRRFCSCFSLFVIFFLFLFCFAFFWQLRVANTSSLHVHWITNNSITAERQQSENTQIWGGYLNI